MKYSPWRKKADGKGYIRDVIPYEYTSNERTDSVDPYEIMKSMKSKPMTTEEKDILYDDDSTTTSDIVVTETIRDVDDHRHCIPTSLGLIAFVGIVFVLSDYAAYHDFELRRDYFRFTYDSVEEFIDDIKHVFNVLDYRLTRKVIKERLEYVGDKIVKLREEYHDFNDKYGDINSDDTISPETLQNIKKYVKRF